MTDWKTVPLGSNVKFLSGGTPSKDQPRYWNGSIPWVSSGEMTQRRISDTQLRTTPDGVASGSRLVPKNTVLVVVRGMSLAKEFRVAISCRDITFNQDLKALIPGKDIDPVYLFYYLHSQSNAIRDSASEAAHGTKKLDMPVLEQWPLVYPGLRTQRKIAAVLTAYDDLIEINRERIALLERMAEQLYREWFVRFRFPGHEHAKFGKGLPVGWDTALASKFFGYVRGKSYASDDLSEDPKQAPFITLKSFNRGGGYRADGLKRFSGRHKPEQLVHLNDIVMAVTDMTQGREVIGRVARVPDFGGQGAVISMDVIKLVPKTISSSFLYSYMRLSGFGEFIKEFANGTNVLHLKPDLVTQQRITMPPKDLREHFSTIIEPIFEQIDVLSRAISPLEASRDLLLPRLISGKLRVDDLDIQFPPSMQDAAA